ALPCAAQQLPYLAILLNICRVILEFETLRLLHIDTAEPEDRGDDVGSLGMGTPRRCSYIEVAGGVNDDGPHDGMATFLALADDANCLAVFDDGPGKPGMQ